jgi:hypothetical protein
MQAKTIINRIAKCKEIIAKERDELREILSEDIVDSSDSSICQLEDAIDTLSQYL